MAEITWHNEKRAIRDLIPYEVNPRQITNKQAKDLKASLAKFGIADPLIINTDNMIIGGHQRKKILETLLGYDPDYQIDVRVPDRELSIDEARELNARIRETRVRAGLVDDARTTTGSDGLSIGRGDVIQTRQNDSDVQVANRQTWTVQGVGGDGTVWAKENGSGFFSIILKNPTYLMWLILGVVVVVMVFQGYSYAEISRVLERIK